MKIQVMDKNEAKKKGYLPLTTSYKLGCQTEEQMLRNVISDMKRGDVDFVLVQPSLLEESLECWRKGMKL